MHADQVLSKAFRRARRLSYRLGLTRLLFSPIVNLIDVGAAGDLPSPWQENRDRIKFLLSFEPREGDLRTSRHISINTALWKEPCKRTFYIHAGHGGAGSSLFRQNFEYVEKNFESLRTRGPKDLAETWFERSKLVESRQVSCQTLDSVLRELKVEFHFLKIDAQGAEYEILQGGRNFIATGCLGLHLELFVIPLYQGITLLPEVEAYLGQFGFVLARKFPAHGTFDSQHDCLFLKDGVDSDQLRVIKSVYGIAG